MAVGDCVSKGGGVTEPKGAAMDRFALRPMTGQPGAVALARYAPNCVVLFYDFMIGEARQCSALVNSSYRDGR